MAQLPCKNTSQLSKLQTKGQASPLDLKQQDRKDFRLLYSFRHARHAVTGWKHLHKLCITPANITESERRWPNHRNHSYATYCLLAASRTESWCTSTEAGCVGHAPAIPPQAPLINTGDRQFHSFLTSPPIERGDVAVQWYLSPYQVTSHAEHTMRGNTDTATALLPDIQACPQMTQPAYLSYKTLCSSTPNVRPRVR